MSWCFGSEDASVELMQNRWCRVIDGEVYSKAHVGLQITLAREQEVSPHLDLKPQISAWKQQVFDAAILRKWDILLPVTGTSVLTDEPTLHALRDKGYTIHVVELLVSKTHVNRFEALRSVETGRPFNMETKLVELTAALAARLRTHVTASGGKRMVVDNDFFRWASLDLEED